jgi:hypothetical protein
MCVQMCDGENTTFLRCCLCYCRLFSPQLSFSLLPVGRDSFVKGREICKNGRGREVHTLCNPPSPFLCFFTHFDSSFCGGCNETNGVQATTHTNTNHNLPFPSRTNKQKKGVLITTAASKEQNNNNELLFIISSFFVFFYKIRLSLFLVFKLVFLLLFSSALVSSLCFCGGGGDGVGGCFASIASLLISRLTVFSLFSFFLFLLFFVASSSSVSSHVSRRCSSVCAALIGKRRMEAVGLLLSFAFFLVFWLRERACAARALFPSVYHHRRGGKAQRTKKKREKKTREIRSL